MLSYVRRSTLRLSRLHYYTLKQRGRRSHVGVSKRVKSTSAVRRALRIIAFAFA